MKTRSPSTPSFLRKLTCTAALACTLSAATPVLAGVYDGVWTVASLPGSYFVLRENAGSLLVIELWSGRWNAYLGNQSGTTATVTNLIADVTASITVQFTSLTTATITVNSCSGPCDLPTGAVAQAAKIF